LNFTNFRSGSIEDVDKVKKLLGSLRPLWEASMTNLSATEVEKQAKLDCDAVKAKQIRDAALNTTPKRTSQ